MSVYIVNELHNRIDEFLCNFMRELFYLVLKELFKLIGFSMAFNPLTYQSDHP